MTRDTEVFDAIQKEVERQEDGLELIAIGGPKPEDGDGVMGEAAWPDAA